MTTVIEKEIADLEAQVDDLTKQLTAAVEAAKDVKKAADADLQKQIDDLKAQVAKSEAEKAEAVAKAGMSDDEKEYCKDMDAPAKAKFLAMEPDDRRKAMKVKKDADETVTVEGQEIRKSVVGDASFTILKAQSARLKQAEEDIAKERDARQMSDLRKRADDEYKHVPGSTDDRANILKALAAMEEPLRKCFEAVLTQSEKLAKGLFERTGSAGDDIEKRRKGSAEFERKVGEIQKRDKLTKTEAMSKARIEYPTEFAAYQDVS